MDERNVGRLNATVSNVEPQERVKKSEYKNEKNIAWFCLLVIYLSTPQRKSWKNILKGLDLHHSRLAGRRINVEFTIPGSGKSLKRKNVVLQKKTFWKNEWTNKKAGKFNKQQKKGRGRR
ncbi:uncharacterized protein LOC144451643 [Glandiceps talaboti]